MPADKNPEVRFDTSQGQFTLRLFPDKAPKTVENFLQYVADGFYDDTIIHRVVNRFIVQGGCFQQGMVQKTTRLPIQNEANNGLLNVRGTVAMARLPDDPHSATSQYFINVHHNGSLNYRGDTGDLWGYCVFGEVIDGMDVVDHIAGMATHTQGAHENVPFQEIVVKSVQRLRSSQ
jgi:cyclophilin family peptidyl-prolyl cis-trans isomerase